MEKTTVLIVKALIFFVITALCASVWCLAEWLVYGMIEDRVIDNIVCIILATSLYKNITSKMTITVETR